MSVKFGDIISKYDGSEDFAEWIEKVELVASLQNVKSLQKFFPLFLVGSAFSCYKSLDDYVKKDYELLKKAMIEKFCLDPCLAYEEFIRRRLQQGESVEFFYSDICRLAYLCDKNMSDVVIKSAFLAGLPIDVKSQIRASNDVTQLSLQDCISRAKAIIKSVDICATSIVGSDVVSAVSVTLNVFYAKKLDILVEIVCLGNLLNATIVASQVILLSLA